MNPLAHDEGKPTLASPNWMKQPERGTPFALRLILWIALHVGRPAARFMLYPISAYFFVTAKEQRRASISFLRRIFGHRPRWHHIFKHIHYFASTILDRVYLLSDKFEPFDICIYNAEILFKYVEQRQGCLLLGSHLGSFEVLRAMAMHIDKFELKILMYAEHNQSMSSLLATLNPKMKDMIIPLGDPLSVVGSVDCLQKGTMVGMLGDRVDTSSKTVICNFLGDKVNFPAGPALIASVAKVPVILFFGLYKGKGRYDIHFELLTEETSLKRQNRDVAVQTWMQKYCDRLEYFTKQSPYNWFNFYDFWNDTE